MKTTLIVIVVTLISGAIQVKPGRTWPLSLTPVRQERIARNDLSHVCAVRPGPAVLVHAPMECFREHWRALSEQTDRQLKRLQRQHQQPRLR